MRYYHCTRGELQTELHRRNIHVGGRFDTLCEKLTKDDSGRGTDATTLTTTPILYIEPKENLRSAGYGKPCDPQLLVGEQITGYTVNTFFPALQLFFNSGRAVTIEGGTLRHARIHLDPILRFRLTHLIHEEDGIIYNPITTKPLPIKILEVAIAERESVAAKLRLPMYDKDDEKVKVDGIWVERHVVVGLRLEGIKEMGYVSVCDDVDEVGRYWGDVRVSGLRGDVPSPFAVLPRMGMRIGGRERLVLKGA
ncbi:hypothetical protein K469DRAFT_725172 [Zopfia rhizophila CBS 207.26]|uniref:Uncharacterized protein n=1 Tax=Zopfia rhizophila CBS 207.26 TaxID=1314779 RepID=A0A6A6E7A9_9PEZI|nr:hypothetical protein K469DRAFT_725172 [Zopfia rhizophila CBS 207.26]